MPARKRGRSAEDDEDDQSVPISKRINRLQIAYSSDDLQQQQQQQQQQERMGESSSHGHQQQMMGESAQAGQYNGAQHAGIFQQHNVSPGSLYPNSGMGEASKVPTSPHLPSSQHPQTSPNLNGVLVEAYQPDLDATQNPNYYHINEVLYQANLERLRRNPFGGHS